MKSKAVSDPCICKVCSCGKHKMCKPLWTCGPALDAHSEYCENYKKYAADAIIKGKSAAPILVPLSGGAFVANTESKEQFIKHRLPQTVSAKKAEVILQGGSFESDTTQKLDYQVWPISKVPQRRHPQVAINSSGAFDGTTTNKRDYLAFPLPSKFKIKPAEYIRSDAETLKESVQAEDYKPWNITVIPTRRTAAAPHFSAHDDRDFCSTSASSYIGHKSTRILARKVYDIPVSEKFEAVTTSKDAYQKWALPKKYQTPKAIYIYNDAPTEKQTEYSALYNQPKTISKYVHQMPPYIPNDAKFEAKSTHKTDFNHPGKITKSEDFGPRNKYMAVADTRDFVTEAHGELTSKTLPICPAANWLNQQRSIHPDGHIYLAEA